MAKYLIHTYPKRLFYVKAYIIPSLLEKGVYEADISVYNDVKMEGNLEAWLKSCEQLPDEGGTWHLQDDILVCRDFKERTEELDEGIVCGFGSEQYDDKVWAGFREPPQMWWSFPCIRIPNKLAKECAAWVRNEIIGNPVYKEFWSTGEYDDWCFKLFMTNKHPKELVNNVSPTLVEHIDWLIGNSSRKNSKRLEVCRSLNFEDNDLVEELKEALEKDGTLGNK